MADWSTPQLSSVYTVFRQALNDRLVDAALMFDSASTSATNIPTSAKRWNSSSSKFEKYDGSAWSDLSSLYAINISGNAATATTATTANGLAAGVAIDNLADKSITYAKIQDISTSQRILGRNHATNGVPQELSLNVVLGWLSTTQGAMLYRGASSWGALAPGTLGQVLTCGGAGANPLWGDLSQTDKIQPITASVSGGALTISLLPTELDFRSATVGSGSVNTRKVSSTISCVVPSGATLGGIIGTGSTSIRLIVYAIDNSGTVELAVANQRGNPYVHEAGTLSTVAVGTGADSSTEIYSTTARTNVPFRVVGYIDITEGATPGVWDSQPTLIQGAGGNSLSAISGIGVGQTYQSVTRTSGTTYYNSTGRSILLIVSSISNGALTITVNGVSAKQNTTSGSWPEASVIIPPGANYVITCSVGYITTELR